MQPVEPVLTVDLYPELHVELLALLRALPLAGWEKPTVAVPWTVRDMAAHLLDTNMRLLSLRRDKLPPLKPERPISGYADLVAFVNQLNADWVRVARRISPELMIDLLALVGPQVHTFFKTLDPYAPSPGAVSWAGKEVAPNWFDLAREYTEKWHHQMHIREAVGAPESVMVSRRYLHPVLDTFVRALPHTYRDMPAPEGTQVMLLITGEAGDAWTLVREGSAAQSKAWRLYQGTGTAAAALVQMGQDTAWRLFTKGIAPEVARARTLIEGDATLGEHLLHAVAIIA